jgi:hypothetical protein
VKDKDETEEEKSSKKLKKSQSNDELNYPITSLLKRHKLLEKSELNIFPKTSFLNDHFLSESRKVVSFSLINNKIFQSYLDVLKKLDPIIQVSNKFKESKKTQQIDNLNLDQAVQSLKQILKEYEIACDYLINEIPGLTELSIEYRTVIIKRNLIDLFIITFVNYYENGEINLYLDNGYHYSRQLTEKLRGKMISDLMYQTYDCLKELNITEREKAILLAYIFTLDGIK